MSDTRAWTRRRVIRIAAAAAGLPLMIAGVRATAPRPQLFRWQGRVLDDEAELSLWHADAALCRRAILKVKGEIARFERIFSLYAPDSEISLLNAAGELRHPSPELRAVIEESQRFGALTGGAFDISVQPLWQLYEAHFWSQTHVVEDILARAQEVARALVDFRRIDTGASRIAFARERMGITLNSIAQGFITDAITDLLLNEGFNQAVIDLGEFRTLGTRPDGEPWRIGVRNAPVTSGTINGGLSDTYPCKGEVDLRSRSGGGRGTDAEFPGSGPHPARFARHPPLSGEGFGARRTNHTATCDRPAVAAGSERVIALTDRALAVAGGYGTIFEPSGRFHHIFEPQTGASANALADAAVTAPRASTASALAVAICVVGEERSRVLLQECPGARAIVTRPDGSLASIG